MDLGPFVVPIVIAGIVLAILLVAGIYSSYYIKVPPNRVAIFSGRRGIKIVHGGGRLRVPLIERVDYMELAPFELPITLQGAYSKEGVPVNMQATAIIRFGSTDEAINTAVQRFLGSDRGSLTRTIQEAFSGHVRSIVAKMNVEELNSSRDTLVSSIATEAIPDLSKIGMELDILTIQHITDEHGYLDALGRRRIAEVKRDAEIGEAEAQRESLQKTSEAQRLGATVAADNAAQVAEAERDRDVRIQKAQAEVAAETARAAQAGPLAENEARKAVVEAEVQVEQTRVTAEIAVEQQRALREEANQQATIVVPAEAKKRATILAAEASREATVAQATADSQAATLAGEGAANARKSQASAIQTEMEAEAAGMRAKLLAEAEGKEKLAEALNAFQDAGLLLEVLPALISKMPEIVAASAAPLGNIDRVVMFDSGNGNGSGPMSNFIKTGSMGLAQANEVIKTMFGLDFGDLVSRFGSGTRDRVRVGAREAVEDAASVPSDPEKPEKK